MNTYWFDLKVSGPVTDDHVEALGNVLTGAGGIGGARGPGGFPAPKVRRQRASLYSWAEVSTWLAGAKLGEVDYQAAQVAYACALVNAALTVRNGMRGLPAHDRPLLA